MVRHDGNRQESHDCGDCNQRSLHKSPPKIIMMSGRDRLANEAEAEIAETERGTKVMIAIRNPDRFLRLRPAASADDRQRDPRAALIPGLATFTGVRWRTGWIIHRRRSEVGRQKGIGGPFADVAEHVIKAPCIRFFASYRMRLIIGVFPIPRDLINWPISGALRSRSGRILPLGFCG